MGSTEKGLGFQVHEAIKGMFHFTKNIDIYIYQNISQDPFLLV